MKNFVFYFNIKFWSTFVPKWAKKCAHIGPNLDQISIQNSIKKMLHFFMDFGSILGPMLGPTSVQNMTKNGPKTETKRWCKNICARAAGRCGMRGGGPYSKYSQLNQGGTLWCMKTLHCTRRHGGGYIHICIYTVLYDVWTCNR